MKNILELKEKKIPVVRIDKSLNKYSNVVLFPDKVEKAKQAIAKFGLPDFKKQSRQQLPDDKNLSLKYIDGNRGFEVYPNWKMPTNEQAQKKGKAS